MLLEEKALLKIADSIREGITSGNFPYWKLELSEYPFNLDFETLDEIADMVEYGFAFGQHDNISWSIAID